MREGGGPFIEGDECRWRRARPCKHNGRWRSSEVGVDGAPRRVCHSAVGMRAEGRRPDPIVPPYSCDKLLSCLPRLVLPHQGSSAVDLRCQPWPQFVHSLPRFELIWDGCDITAREMKL